MSKKGADQRLEDARIKEDLETQLAAETKSQAEKVNGAKGHLLAVLSNAGQKYLTVNGFMQARQTLRDVLFEDEMSPTHANNMARDIAREMTDTIELVTAKIADTDAFDLDDSVLDGLLVDDFIKQPKTYQETTTQLLVVQFLQNIGPLIDELVQFRGGSQMAIDALTAELEKYAEPSLEVVN